MVSIYLSIYVDNSPSLKIPYSSAVFLTVSKSDSHIKDPVSPQNYVVLPVPVVVTFLLLSSKVESSAKSSILEETVRPYDQTGDQGTF